MPSISCRLAAAACLLLTATGAMAASPSFTGLHVFGDSLSDSGNVFAITGGLYPPPPYFEGRLSNGPVAVEWLATGLKLDPGQFRNFAIGGAKTGNDGLIPATGMLTQLALYQLSLGASSADAAALYVVWGGGNDLRDGDPIGDVIGNLTSIVTTLHDKGARQFLLPNLPDLGLLPEARESGGSTLATLASASFNQQLATAYSQLATQWSDETFYFFDVMGAQREITAGSPGNGFTNVASGCITTPGCTPDSFLYWDQTHPTAIVHAILGQRMLAAVPEPGSMLMLAAGVFGLLIATARRRA